MIGRMTESLIGAVGLKEFVFGTSFLSVSLKDQDSSEAAPSSSLSISLPYLLFPVLSVSLCSSHTLFWPHVCLCAFFSFWDSLAIFLCPASMLADNQPGPPQNRKGSRGPEDSGQGPAWQNPLSMLCVFFGQIREALGASVFSSTN